MRQPSKVSQFNSANPIGCCCINLNFTVYDETAETAMTTERQMYQTQVYHSPSSTLQNQVQSPDSPVASYSTAAVISPASSPSSSTMRVNNANTIASAMSISYDDGDDAYIIASLKSPTDVYRERGANVRALSLLDVSIAAGVGVPSSDKPRPSGASGMTAGRAAAFNYEQQQKQKMAHKANLKREMEEAFPKRAPVLVAPSRRNKLAETTRKIKKPSAEESADFGIDSIADMKCQLDLDREEQAKHKALRLLNYGFMS